MYRNDLQQEVEGLVDGRLSIKVVVLGAEFVMQHSLQALSQGAGFILQPGRLLMHFIRVLLQLLVLPVTLSTRYAQSLTLLRSDGAVCWYADA